MHCGHWRRTINLNSFGIVVRGFNPGAQNSNALNRTPNHVSSYFFVHRQSGSLSRRHLGDEWSYSHTQQDSGHSVAADTESGMRTMAFVLCGWIYKILRIWFDVNAQRLRITTLLFTRPSEFQKKGFFFLILFFATTVVLGSLFVWQQHSPSEDLEKG